MAFVPTFHIQKHILIRKRSDETAALWESQSISPSVPSATLLNIVVLKVFTVMYHSLIGMCSEKCVSQQFQYCATMMEDDYTKLGWL